MGKAHLQREVGHVDPFCCHEDCEQETLLSPEGRFLVPGLGKGVAEDEEGGEDSAKPVNNNDDRKDDVIAEPAGHADEGSRVAKAESVHPEHGEAGPDGEGNKEHGEGQGQVGPDGEGGVSLEDGCEVGTEGEGEVISEGMVKPDAVNLGYTKPDGRGGQEVQAPSS